MRLNKKTEIAVKDSIKAGGRHVIFAWLVYGLTLNANLAGAVFIALVASSVWSFAMDHLWRT